VEQTTGQTSDESRHRESLTAQEGDRLANRWTPFEGLAEWSLFDNGLWLGEASDPASSKWS
jgi:hypothetical protein